MAAAAPEEIAKPEVPRTAEPVPPPATDEFKLPELEPVVFPEARHAEFTGRKLAIIHTGNVTGELEPCG